MKCTRLFTAIIFCLFTAISLQAQNVTYITLQQIKPDYSANEFFIGKVIDDRNPRGAFGTIYKENGKSLIATQNGIAPALNDFIGKSLSQNRNKPAVTLHITSLNITVKKTDDNWITEASVVYTYYAGDEQLMEFSNTGRERSGNYSTDFIEVFIRKSLIASMKRFDSWSGSNKSRLTAASNAQAKRSTAANTKGSKAKTNTTGSPYLDKEEAAKAFELLNKIRSNPDKYLPEMGINQYSTVTRTRLVWNEQLAKAAQAKAMDMAKKQYFGHVDPEGYGMNYYINKAGYTLDRQLLENKSDNFFESIQAGAIDGETSIQDLILDEGTPNLGHRKHLLGMDKWTTSLYDIGIGFVQAGSGSRYRTYTSVIIAKHK